MKKVLSLVVFCLFGVLLTVGILVFLRASKNPEEVFPFPYSFRNKPTPISLEAPILITGDRMGVQLTKFKDELAEVISSNLDNKIKIQSIAKDGHALHRTLHELNGLTQWPQIVIYQGASQEFLEKKFELSEIPQIRTNFNRYQNDGIQTFLILYPWFSRVVYEPLKRVFLEETPELKTDISENEYLQRLETEYLLFEQQLIRLAQTSKNRGSLLILTTTPVNLDSPPKKVCEFTGNLDIQKEILDLREMLAANNPKGAYAQSSEALKRYSGNALLYFIHGQSAKRLGMITEARNSLLEASAFDCEPWRATEVYNSIIRRVADGQQILLFDFAKLTEKEWSQGPTFFDDHYPQNLFYSRGVKQLGLVIKNILKL